MYRPYGRYRYTGGFVCDVMPYAFTPTDEMSQNWRAVVTVLVTVPPNLPGLIASVNPTIQIGGTFKIFDFAWLFGVSCSLFSLGAYR